ncbi:MAG: TolC family protein [Verrucomicrobiae bacterium]
MKRLHLLAYFLFVASSLLSQGAAQAASRIDDLVAAALAENAELKAFEAELEKAKGMRTQAGFFKNPEVSIEVGGREVRDSENILQGNGTTLGVAIMQRFEFPGKGTLRKAIANKNVEISGLGMEQFRLALAGQVRLLALEHLAAVAEARAAEAIYKQSAGLASRMNSQADFGARLKIELRLVQAGMVELAAAIKQASLRSEETRTRLNALIGRPQGLPLHIADVLVPPAGKFDEKALALSAQKNNLLLKIRHSELVRSARELTAARLDIAPDFSIGPFFSRDVAGDTEQNLGGAISATVPLWDWNIGNIQSAKARLAGAEALRVKGERDTEAQALSLLKAYELTRRQLGMLPAGLMEDLQEASTLADTQFRGGSIGAQLYLDAQSAYLNSLRISQGAVLDAWRSFLDLTLLTGGRLDGSATPASNTMKPEAKP